MIDLFENINVESVNQFCVMPVDLSFHPMYESAIKNRRIRVFLSSTFKDMSDERDFLAKTVFMELEAEALKRNVSLNLLDLRWGITAEESKKGSVIEICLREIENSRPFFIGIIGDRYGWVPAEEDFPADSPLYSAFPWIKDCIKNGFSITEMEFMHGVLNSDDPIKAFFYIKESSLDDFDGSEDELEKLNALKTRVVDQDVHPVKYYKDPAELGKLIKEDMMDCLEMLFPQSDEQDPIKIADHIQDCILRKKTEFYVPIDGTYDYINDFLLSPQRLLAVTGESGTGKSSLLANWIVQNNNSCDVIYHFVDSAYYGNDPSFILVRLYYKICHLLNITPDIEWDKILAERYVSVINQLLSKCDRDLVLVIDGLNQLEAGGDSYALRWFPQLSKNVKIICSTNNDNDELLTALRNKSAVFYTIPLFSDSTTMGSIVNGYLELSGKKLDEEQLALIYDNKLFETPLLLFSLLEELRIWGVYEELDDRIRYYVSSTEESDLFDKIFDRLERDSSIVCPRIVAEVFVLLSLSRNGVADSDIAEILGIARIHVVSLLYKCHRFISVLGGRSTISHSLVTKAVKGRYADVYENVQNKYKAYLSKRMAQSSYDNFAPLAQEMGHLLYHSSLDDDLHALCTNPAVFIMLSLYNSIDGITYWKHLFQKGYTMEAMLGRLDELSHDMIESAILHVLFHARGICSVTHNNNELKRVLDYSASYIESCPESTESDLMMLKCHLLTYYIRIHDYERVVELSDQVLYETESDEYRIIAYQYKAQACQETDFALSIKCLEEAASLSVKIQDYESAVVAYTNLGLFFSQRGTYDKALYYYNAAYHLIDKAIKDNASLIVQRYVCLMNMTSLYRRIGNFSKESAYERLAQECFKEIYNTPYEAYLQPEVIIVANRRAGFNLMIKGNTEEGAGKLDMCVEMLERSKSDLSADAYYKELFSIKHDCAKGYAYVGDFISAVKQLITIDQKVRELFRESPLAFFEIYFEHLSVFAKVLADLGYYKASLHYYNTIIVHSEKVRQSRGLGNKSFIARIWKKIAVLLIKENEKTDAFDAYEKSMSEILPFISEDHTFLMLYARYKVEQEYFIKGGEDKDFFKLEHLKVMHDKAKEAVHPLSTFLAVCLLERLPGINNDNYELVEECIDTIFNGSYVQCGGDGGDLKTALLSYVAIYCDDMSCVYFKRGNIKRSIYYSKQSVACYEQVTLEKYRCPKLQAIHHLANSLDTVGDKKQALAYYRKAISEFDKIDATDHDFIKLKSVILYDYAIAIYGDDITYAELVLDEALNTAYSIYDEYGYIAIIVADIQESLGNLYDDTGRFDDAEKMYKSAIHVLSKKRDDPDHANRLGKFYNNYGIMLIKQNRLDEAWEMLGVSREIRLNNDKRGLLRTDDILYRLSMMEKNFTDAYKYLKEILEVCFDTNDVGYSQLNEFANYTNMFAELCLQIGKADEGKQAYKRLYGIIASDASGVSSETQLNNIVAVVMRATQLFGTTDFLK